MLESPVGRCFGIGVLLVGLGGLFVLGGAGWSLDAAVAGDSSGIDEIGVFQNVNLDPGSEYRDSESTSIDRSSGVDSMVAAGSGDTSSLSGILFAPTDRSEAIHFGGLRFLYVVSLVGAALVGVRALFGWRIEVSVLALEPRETASFSSGEKMVSQPTQFREQRPGSQE